MTTMEIGKQLVELCNKGQVLEAVEQLYDQNIISIEPFAPPGKSARMEGIQAVRGKGEWWLNNHTIHRCVATGPFPNGDRFVVMFNLDVTAKSGPMAGKRFEMNEAALYTVKNGKVTQEEFFYSMG